MAFWAASTVEEVRASQHQRFQHVALDTSNPPYIQAIRNLAPIYTRGGGGWLVGGLDCSGRVRVTEPRQTQTPIF